MTELQQRFETNPEQSTFSPRSVKAALREIYMKKMLKPSKWKDLSHDFGIILVTHRKRCTEHTTPL